MKKLSLTHWNKLGTKRTETKIFGVYWNKQNDTLGIYFKVCKDKANNEATKRNLPRAMASVYDPLGVASPMLLVANQLYRTIYDEKIAWDKPLPKDVERKWLHWLISLPEAIYVPRSLSICNQKIHEIELHGFGDASKDGCCSAIYLLVKHAGGTTTDLLTAKSRISKKDTS